jgi:hypothetical protein
MAFHSGPFVALFLGPERLLVRSPECLKLLLAAAGGVALEVTGVGLDAMYAEASMKPAG